MRAIRRWAAVACALALWVAGGWCAEPDAGAAAGAEGRAAMEKWCDGGGRWFEGESCVGCTMVGMIGESSVMAILTVERADGKAPEVGNFVLRRNGTKVAEAVALLEPVQGAAGENAWMVARLWELDGAISEDDEFVLRFRGDGFRGRHAAGAKEMERDAKAFEMQSMIYFMAAETAGAIPDDGMYPEDGAAFLVENGVAAEQVLVGEGTVTTLLALEEDGELAAVAFVGQWPGSEGRLAPEGMTVLRNGKELLRERKGFERTLRAATEDTAGVVVVAARWMLGSDGLRKEDAFVLRAEGTDVEGSHAFTGADLMALAESERAAKEKIERRMGRLYGEMLLGDAVEDHSVAGSEAEGRGTIIVARDGSTGIECMVSVGAEKGTPMTLLPSGLRLERNGEAVPLLGMDAPEMHEGETEGREIVLMTAYASWRLESAAQEDDVFVLTAKGLNVDLRREFAWSEASRNGLMFGDADESGSGEEEGEEVDGARTARRKVAMDHLLSLGIAEGRIFEGERAVVGVDAKMDGRLAIMATLTAVDFPGSRSSLRMEDVTMRRNGRALERVEMAPRTVMLAATETEGGKWIAGAAWQLDSPAKADDVFVLVAKGEDVDVRAEFAGAEVMGDSEAGSAEDDRRLMTMPAMALAREFLPMDKAGDDQLFLRPRSATLVVPHGDGANRLWFSLMAVGESGATLELPAEGIVLSRNGQKLVAEPGGEASVQKISRGEAAPTMLAAFPAWRMGTALRTDDVFELEAKGTNIDLKHEFRGADVMTAEQMAREREASWDGSGVAPGTKAVVPCKVVAGQFHARVAFTIGGETRERTMLVDTGASITLLPESDLPPGVDVESFGDTVVTLANGRSVAAKVATMRVEVGGLGRDVRVGTLRGGDASALLGANFFGDASCLLDPKAGTMTITLPGGDGDAEQESAGGADDAAVAKARAIAMDALKKVGTPDEWIVQGPRTVVSMVPLSTSSREVMVGVRVDELPGGQADLRDAGMVVTLNGEVLEEGLLSQESPEQGDEHGMRLLRVTKRWRLPKPYADGDTFVVTAKGKNVDAQWTLTGGQVARSMSTMAEGMGRWLEEKKREGEGRMKDEG